MIKREDINPYKFKLCANKAEYRISSGLYRTTHDLKIPFSMPEFYSRKIITYRTWATYEEIKGLDMT